MSQLSLHRGLRFSALLTMNGDGRHIYGENTSMKRRAIPTTVDRRDFYGLTYSAYNLFEGL